MASENTGKTISKMLEGGIKVCLFTKGSFKRVYIEQWISIKDGALPQRQRLDLDAVNLPGFATICEKVKKHGTNWIKEQGEAPARREQLLDEIVEENKENK